MARSSVKRAGTRAPSSGAWTLLEAAQNAERLVSSAKRGADQGLRIRKAVQVHEDLLGTLDELDSLRVSCDELGGPGALEAFPAIPKPPVLEDDLLAWWESEDLGVWVDLVSRAANSLESITEAGWSALVESVSPAIPSEHILANLEAASPGLRRECASIRRLLASWDKVASKKLPAPGDAALVGRIAKEIEEGWQALEDAGGAPERLELLTRLSAQPPTVTLADLSEEDWEWLIESDLASAVFLSMWER